MPELLISKGKDANKIYPLGVQTTTIGRAADRTIVINDPQVSRCHAEIVQNAEGFCIQDTGSNSGVFVNGTRVQQARLRNGDRIRVAEWVGVFRDETGAEQGPARAAIFEDEGGTLADAHIRRGASVVSRYSPAREVPHVRDPEVLQQRLRELDAINRAVNSHHDMEGLLAEITRRSLLAFPKADACAILLRGANEGDLAALSAQRRQGGGKVRVSRTIVNEAMRSQKPVCYADVRRSDLRAHTSIAEERIVSAICAPLVRDDEAFGALYLDARRSRADWADADLRLLANIANIIALAYHNTRFYEEMGRAKETLNQEVAELRRRVGDQFRFEGIVGVSPSMHKAIEAAKRVSQTDSTVLITGETGVGKELFARAIHYNSARGDGPFVARDCARGSESVIESELFGTEGGAFTGISKTQAGVFEAADGGTLFLDEINNMPLSAQALLLRAIETGAFTRVGGVEEIETDVRLMIATNADLGEEVKRGRFREDLYYRISVVPIHVPPLRERRDDILELAEHFLSELNFRYGKSVEGFTDSAHEALLGYAWPGNVRELRHAVEGAVNKVENGVPIDAHDLPEEIAKTIGVEMIGDSQLRSLQWIKDQVIEAARADGPAQCGSLGRLRDVFEKEIIETALSATGGNVARAARILKTRLSSLRGKIRRLGIEIPKG